MQHDNLQFTWRFGCAMLVAAIYSLQLLASSRGDEQYIAVWKAYFFLTPHTFIIFKITVFSSNWCWLKWHRLRQMISYHASHYSHYRLHTTVSHMQLHACIILLTHFCSFSYKSNTNNPNPKTHGKRLVKRVRWHTSMYSNKPASGLTLFTMLVCKGINTMCFGGWHRERTQVFKLLSYSMVGKYYKGCGNRQNVNFKGNCSQFSLIFFQSNLISHDSEIPSDVRLIESVSTISALLTCDML